MPGKMVFLLLPDNKHAMALREIIYAIFYCLCFLLAIFAGIKAPDSHTPPGAFIVAVLALAIGAILLLIDLILSNVTRVHKIGLGVNGLLVAYIVIVSFI
jgi:hypothetical protein